MKTVCFWLIFAFFFISVKGWCSSADNKERIKNTISCGNILAKAEDYLVINLKMEQQYHFALSERPVVTFEGGDMVVTTVSNSITIPIQSVTCWKFLKVNPVVVTAKSYTREYGDANPVFEFTSEGAALDGEPEITCAATETSPVGTYDIVVKQGTVKNYNVNYVDGTLTVTKAPLTVKAGEYTIKQGEALPEFVASYEGWKNDETVAVLTKQPILTTMATSESEPGTYDVLISGAEAQNYDISYMKGTLTITEADPVTITAKSYTREYGDANPVFEYTSEGAALDGEPEIICEATETSPIGTYDIVVKQGTVKNYNVTYVDGSLTVTKAPLAVKAGEYKIKQGEAFPEFTASYTGFKNNETETVLTKLPTLSTTATSESEPGTYEVVVSGAEAQNYDISYINGILVVEENLAGIAQVMMDKNNNVMIFTIDGRRVDKPKKGLYVVRMKDGTIRKVGLWKSGIR